MHGGGVVLHRLFLDDAQDLQRARFGVADVAGAVAARAGDVVAFAQRWAQALAAELEQAELADGRELHPRAVLAHRVAQSLLDLAAVLALLHVDEVDDDQAAEVAQPHLARDLVGRFQVGAGGGFFDVAAAGGARRVDVDRDQRLGVVDHDRAASWQVDGARERGLDLVLDLEAREQRRVVTVALHAIGRLRHHVVHELLGLLEDVVRVDQDLADVGGEVVADRADDQARFLVDQERALARLACAVDRRPQLEHVVQVPLQLGRRAPDACGAGDQRHALRIVELLEVLFQFLAVLALDPAADAATARVVGHQHQVAPSQRDKGGQRRALVAALFLLDLDQHLLAFADRFLDADVLEVDTFAEILARDFLERQKPVAIFAVVDETGLERRLDPGHHRHVDVALALFAPLDLGFEIEQFLPVNDGQAAFFRLRGIDQHAFHVHSHTVRPVAEAHTVRSLVQPSGRDRRSVQMHELRETAVEGIALDCSDRQAIKNAAGPRASGPSGVGLLLTPDLASSAKALPHHRALPHRPKAGAVSSRRKARPTQRLLARAGVGVGGATACGPGWLALTRTPGRLKSTVWGS